jgi:imidazolonepropionase-like amidohydrolase
MIVRARVVVTMDGPPIDNGAVVVSGDQIVDVGEFSKVSKRHSNQAIVDLGDQALLPGLINAHCHPRHQHREGETFTGRLRPLNQ